MRKRFLSLAAALGAAATLHAQWIPANAVTGVQQQKDGALLTMQKGALRLQICTDSIVHVRYSPTGSFPTWPDYVVVKNTWAPVDWKLEQGKDDVTITTPRVKLTIARDNGVIVWGTSDGRKLVQEGPKEMRPVRVNGESTWHAEDVFNIYGSEEGFYGLGQHQAGVWNYRGESVDLSQENTNIAVPFWLSSNGYGILWNNTGNSRFNNRFVHYLYVSSDVADTIDYYFFYGPDFDRIIAGYRELTGAAPLYGKWAYGFWQCKNKYTAQQQILDVAHKYREEHIPLDNIVQDWFWWTSTGEFAFNKNYPDAKGMVDDLHRNHAHIMFSVWPFFYPGTKTYEDMDKRGYFVARTPVKAFHPKGTALYDAFNPEARKYYWKLIDDSLFHIGADAWWMDTTEPETEGVEENLLTTNTVALGNGARYANLYPLMTTSDVYNGQRSESDKKRVYILSRSAFAGSQRFGVTAWSGDVLSDFETYKRQIPAALNFEVSGIPYWTSDIGGFILGHPNDPAYRELFVRWFQFGAFCPIFRVHGTRAPDTNELWSYGADAQSILVSFDKLRYRLMPYIYSMAWMITNDGYTPMRPLVMDFRGDSRALNIGDQYMFGPAILVSPVTEQGATTRHLYLPADTRWYDFWTGAVQQGGKFVDAPAPLDSMPLYVRAGSIVPMGPELEYATEKPADPLELRVYPGHDSDFTLYEDENDGYNYEHGAHATIPLHWDDGSRRLTIGARVGTFPGMLTTRTFHVVFAGPGHGIGRDITGNPDKVVQYSGAEVTVVP